MGEAAEPDGPDHDPRDQPRTAAPDGSSSKGTWEFTDSKLLQGKRDEIVDAVGRSLGPPLIKKSRALYWNPAHNKRIACSISKRYTKRGAYPYWYAYHPQWDEFLREGRDSYFVLGCMDLPFAFSIPWNTLSPLLPFLNTTITDRGSYWHIHLVESAPGPFSLLLPKEGRSLPLERFRVDLHNPGSLATRSSG